jgi:hypothetical protein
MNNGFFDELEYNEYDDSIDELAVELNQQAQANVVLSEAVKRIEQAKLYETMLKHSLFGANSARPEIIAIVENEIKQYILSRLEILLGIKQQQPEKVTQQFSDEETEVLKLIAAKLINKDKPTSSQPTLNQVQKNYQAEVKQTAVSQPVINPIGGNRQEMTHKPHQQQPQKRSRTKTRSQNVSSITNSDYSQAINPNMPPASMPSQAQIDQINAQQAALNSGSSAMGLGRDNPMAKLIGMAAQQMMHINKDVKEE